MGAAVRAEPDPGGNERADFSYNPDFDLTFANGSRNANNTHAQYNYVRDAGGRVTRIDRTWGRGFINAFAAGPSTAYTYLPNGKLATRSGADGRIGAISRSAPSFLRYRHLPLGDRLRVAKAVRRLPHTGSDTETFGSLLRELGCSDASIDSFWDVFVRPALNLSTDEVSAKWGVFTVRTALLSARAASDVILPARPLGSMHGDAAGRALEAAGAAVRTDARVVSLEAVDADAVVLAVPPDECARLLDEPDPGLEHSPIVSVHLLFDRRLLRSPLAALLSSDAHWVFDRGALMGNEPRAGQYLTVVSSGVPELMEIRGRELVDRIAGQLVERLGYAKLLWSRVSREPLATLALRPGVERPSLHTGRPDVVRAGAWTDTGWPATMEGAVRSGLAAARALALSRDEVRA